MESKSQLRKRILKKRNSFTKEYITSASEKISCKLEKLKEFKNAKGVFIYLNFGSEIETLNLIEKYIEEKIFYIPKIVGNEMKLLKFTSLDELRENDFGILEPISDAYFEGNVDLVITPSVTFDERGYRIGYGKGYYDKYFSLGKYKYSVGVCYSELIQKILPIQEHDIKVDIVITD